jgi:hypothetical protein
MSKVIGAPSSAAVSAFGASHASSTGPLRSAVSVVEGETQHPRHRQLATLRTRIEGKQIGRHPDHRRPIGLGKRRARAAHEPKGAHRAPASEQILVGCAVRGRRRHVSAVDQSSAAPFTIANRARASRAPVGRDLRTAPLRSSATGRPVVRIHRLAGIGIGTRHSPRLPPRIHAMFDVFLAATTPRVETEVLPERFA